MRSSLWQEKKKSPFAMNLNSLLSVIKNLRDLICLFSFIQVLFKATVVYFHGLFLLSCILLLIYLGLYLSVFPFRLHVDISVCRAHKFGTSVCLVKCRHTSPFIAPSPPSSLLSHLSLFHSLGIGFGQSHQRHTHTPPPNISVNYDQKCGAYSWQHVRQR